MPPWQSALKGTPALYEAGFVSGAHTADDIAASVQAAAEVFAAL